jgi:uncharacterized protein
MNLEIEKVAEFIRANPRFFEQYPDILMNLQVPHPHGGRTVSISERQILALREKGKFLERKLAELIQFGEENDAIGNKIHTLACLLIGTRSLDEVIDTLQGQLTENFEVPHVTMRLWMDDGAANAASSRDEFSPTNQELRGFAQAMSVPYCGQHAVYETNRWFGEASPQLKSFAMVPLRHGKTFGLLVMASEDAERFYPEMGTLYLQRIGELASAALAPFVTNS